MPTVALTRQQRLEAGALVLVTGFAIVLAIVLGVAGVIVESPRITAGFSFLLLIAGLPHGSFDLALLKRAAAERRALRSTLDLVALYMACAAAMYLAWLLAPALALAAFLIMAVAHFAEDWADCGSSFVSGCIAAAIIAAPALLHGNSLETLFVALTGDPDAAIFADVLLLIAPVSMAIALIGVLLLRDAGRPDLAIGAACGLAAMLLLPPVAGFALFFSLVHSPLQFRQHAAALGLAGHRQWRGIVWPVSLGGLGLAALIFLMSDAALMSDKVFSGSFIALSVLTVPHMIVPMIVPLINAGKARKKNCRVVQG